MVADNNFNASDPNNNLDVDSPALSTSASIASQPQANVVPQTTPLLAASPHDDIISRIDSEVQGLKGNSSSEKSSPVKLRRRELPENMCDPFDGASIGVMVPGEFEEAEDDLWTHLDEVRNLQGDIARMHAQMERLGENDRFYGPEETGEEETVNAEDEAKAAKAAEFAKLSDRFSVRKDAIDAIMQKLQTLSKSINDFHTSRTPLFRTLSSQIPSGDEKLAGKSGIASNKTEDEPGLSVLSSRLLSGSQDDMLKDSPDSITGTLMDHQTPVDR